MERALAENYGTTAQIALDKGSHKGYVEMHFSSLSELKGLLAKLDGHVDTDTLIKGDLTLRADNATQANALLMELGANTDPDLS